MRGLYLDCFSGISGDMMLGALVDLGVPLAHLRDRLGRLAVAGYRISSRRVTRTHLTGTKVNVDVKRKQPGRGIDEITRILDRSRLTEKVRNRALDAFNLLVDAEAHVHGVPRKRVHLHEVGAVDAIVDITGTMIGLEKLGWPRVVCSPLNVGWGMVEMAHGSFPIPGPATAEILKDRPCYATHVEGELVTPTGAALAVTLADDFGPMPPMRLRSVGYGAGSKEFPNHPNLLRAFLGDFVDRGAIQETVLVIETTIDDMNPQLYGHLMDRLFAAGALEVFYTAIQMKKNRPGTMVKVICPAHRLEEVSSVIFRETTTIGFRYQPMGRIELGRRIEMIRTPYGKVSVKVSTHNGNIVQATPEYEDCRALSLKSGVALKDVQRAAAAQCARMFEPAPAAPAHRPSKPKSRARRKGRVGLPKAIRRRAKGRGRRTSARSR